jgi:pimeloyl-ACP methyl ester carboxylesterase
MAAGYECHAGTILAPRVRRKPFLHDGLAGTIVGGIDERMSKVSIELPAPHRVVDLTMEDGATIRLRQHGIPDGRRIALSHGNGLAIDGYLSFWKLLCNRYELILFDFRNHGQNPLHQLEHHNWPRFVQDLERVFEGIQQHFGAKRTAGAFHSLSAVAATMHTQRMGKRWDPLVLFDPPFYPRDGHPLRAVQEANEDDIAARAERRTPSYSDPMELASQFRKYLRGWQPEAYEEMARATLRRDDVAGKWVLACPREYEAHIFRSNRDATTWTGLSHMPVPVKLICGDPAGGENMPPALIGAALAREAAVEYEFIPRTTHFLQIEKPEECVRATEAFFASHGFLV